MGVPSDLGDTALQVILMNLTVRGPLHTFFCASMRPQSPLLCDEIPVKEPEVAASAELPGWEISAT